MKTLKLQRAIITHAGELKELSFREPIGGDYMKLNQLPFETRGQEGDVSIKINFNLATKWACELCSEIDEIILGKMPKTDFFNVISTVNQILIEDGDEPGN